MAGRQVILRFDGLSSIGDTAAQNDIVMESSTHLEFERSVDFLCIGVHERTRRGLIRFKML